MWRARLDREKLIGTLRNLSEVELVKIFYEAFTPLKKVCGSEVDDVYVVGNAALGDGDDTAIVSISALALGATIEADSMVQDGFCERCKIEIQCSSKDAVCPICGNSVDCT